MKCPKCGYKSLFDFIVCPKCGYDLNSEVELQSIQPSISPNSAENNSFEQSTHNTYAQNDDANNIKPHNFTYAKLLSFFLFITFIFTDPLSIMYGHQTITKLFFMDLGFPYTTSKYINLAANIYTFISIFILVLPKIIEIKNHFQKYSTLFGLFSIAFSLYFFNDVSFYNMQVPIPMSVKLSFSLSMILATTAVVLNIIYIKLSNSKNMVTRTYAGIIFSGITFSITLFYLFANNLNRITP